MNTDDNDLIPKRCLFLDNPLSRSFKAIVSPPLPPIFINSKRTRAHTSMNPYQRESYKLLVSEKLSFMSEHIERELYGNHEDTESTISDLELEFNPINDAHEQKTNNRSLKVSLVLPDMVYTSGSQSSYFIPYVPYRKDLEEFIKSSDSYHTKVSIMCYASNDLYTLNLELSRSLRNPDDMFKRSYFGISRIGDGLGEITIPQEPFIKKPTLPSLSSQLSDHGIININISQNEELKDIIAKEPILSENSMKNSNFFTTSGSKVSEHLSRFLKSAETVSPRSINYQNQICFQHFSPDTVNQAHFMMTEAQNSTQFHMKNYIAPFIPGFPQNPQFYLFPRGHYTNHQSLIHSEPRNTVCANFSHIPVIPTRSKHFPICQNIEATLKQSMNILDHHSVASRSYDRIISNPVKSSAARIKESDQENEEALTNLRAKILERNRQAAIKSRQKKKVEMQKLSIELEEKEKHHSELLMILNAARKERDNLEQLLFTHKDCICNIIGTYEQLLRLHRKGEDLQLGNIE